jgi:hypothetical protein
MADLTQRGITPEILERTVGDFDPANYGTPNRKWYESAVTKPTIPDEKRIRNARIVASIGDALGSIVEMAAVGGGAHVKERGYESSALGRTEAKEKELRNLYQQQLARYESGLYDAGVRDVIRGMDQHRRERAELGGALDAKRKMDQNQAEFEATIRQREAEARQRQENLEADRAERKRVNDATIARGNATTAQGWARVKDAQDRTAAYVKNISSDGKNGGIQIAISPVSGDKDVQTDVMGDPMKVFDVSIAEADMLTRDALTDTGFLKLNPRYDRKPGLMGEAPRSFTAAERSEIAAAYMQYVYDKRWADQNTRGQVNTTTGGATRNPYSIYGDYNPVWAGGVEEDVDADMIEN